jgi:predicted AAA+ superfamily ATPase
MTLLIMQTYYERKKHTIIEKHLTSFPCVALLGARQVGKSTLAKKIISQKENSIYIDLEDPRDYAKLQEPMAFLDANSNALICIDEIQRYPDLFTVLRSYIDNNQRNGQLLLLGSASRDLIRQSSESLAGRISYIEINPFTVTEIEDPKKLWIQGGYPDSYKLDEEMSFEWRKNYVRTFLERDIPQLGIKVPAETLRRFWTMLGHCNGQLLNSAKLASSMGVSNPTIKHYLDILEGAFVVRQLPPYYTNTKKRLIKSPKVYIRDSGVTHYLLGIENYNELLGNPALGASYESFIIESIIEHYPKYNASFYRSSSGAEIDLVLQKGDKKIAIEIKSSMAPKLSKGFFESLKVVQPEKSFVIAPIAQPYPIKEDIWAYNIKDFLDLNA